MSHGLLAGAVLAGGRSLRMGTDKATLVVGGVQLAQRGVDALGGAGLARVVVVGGTHDYGAELIADAEVGSGPLGGVITALGAVTPNDVVILPCDLPRIDADAIAKLVAAAAGSPLAMVVVGTVEGRAAWPIGVWRQAAAEPLRLAWAGGERSISGAVRGLGVSPVELGPAAADADEPGDLPGTDTLAAGDQHDHGGAR